MTGNGTSGKLTMIEVVKIDVEITIRKDQTQGNTDQLETNKAVKSDEGYQSFLLLKCFAIVDRKLFCYPG
jgi:hypothetical protein